MSYSKNKYKKFIRKIVAIGIVLILIIAVSFFFGLSDSTQYGMIIMFLLGFFYYPLVQKGIVFFDRKMNEIFKDGQKARQGGEGEKKVFGWLEELVGRENFFKNVQIPGYQFDLDAVIISNRGVIVFEVKNWTNNVRFEGDRMKYWHGRDDSNYLFLSKNPMRKFSYHIEKLKEYLDTNGLRDISIHKAIVFANGKVSWRGNPKIYVIRNKEGLKDFLENTPKKKKLSEERQRKIRSILKES